MQVEEIAIAQDEAKKQLTALKELFKKHADFKKNAIYVDMKRVYGHMHHGGKVIDIYSVFNSDQLKENGDLKIAICRANAKKCYLNKIESGAAIFSAKPFPRNRWVSEPRKTYKDVWLPPGSIDWKLRNPKGERRYWNILNREQNTLVPMIPPHILVEELKRSLGAYYILWEVEDWKQEPPTDPILLKKLTSNLFGVMATWELTDLERAIIKAHIA